MGDDQCGSALTESQQGFLYQSLGFIVQGRGGFVQHQYTVVGILNPTLTAPDTGAFVTLADAQQLFKEQLPVALQQRLATTSNRFGGGHVAGVFVMDVLSALILGPCVAAPLAGALLYISKSGDTVLGGAALFALAMGMGVPLLVVGASAGTLLPKAGPWMESAGFRNVYQLDGGIRAGGLRVLLAAPLVA